MSHLDDFLEGWHFTRSGVIAELENLPEAQVHEAPAGLPKSALELAHHIVRFGRLAAGELSRPDGDFLRKPLEALLEEHTEGDPVPGTRHEAVELLRRSQEEGAERIRTAGEDLMSRPIRQFDGTAASRLSWFHHAISHEEYHRGQMALYARLFGVTPALTRIIQEG